MTSEERAIENLSESGLRIRIEDGGGHVSVVWEGVSDDREPGSWLMPYFERLVGAVRGVGVTVDFSAMEYMNSATVAPILRLVRALNSACPQVTVLYDEDKNFQRTTFSAIKALGIVLANLEVRAKS